MPQLIQYLCPSWRLSLYGRPSALSRWSEADRNEHRMVMQYDRAQLLRLTVDEDMTERLVWEGTVETLEDLQDSLQNYIQDLLQRSHQTFMAAEGMAEPREVEQRKVEPIETDPEAVSDELTEMAQESTVTPALETAVATLPTLRVEAVGALQHQIFLPPDVTLSLSTLECFDLAEVLDQWQAETLNLPTLLQESPKTVPVWLKTAAMFLATVGLSSSVSLLGGQWWQKRQFEQQQFEQRPFAKEQLEVAQSAPEITLEELEPLPNLEGDTNSPNYNPVPRLPSEVYGPPAPGQPDVSLGISIQGERPLPRGDFAGLPMPPPPDFSTLPPPPPGYSGSPDESYPSSVPYETYRPGSYSDYSDDYSDYSSDVAANPAPVEPNTAPLSSETEAARGVESAAAISGTDNTTRIGEIAGYFQGRWQPPQNLTGSLEYQLLIGADGTLQAISPLSDQAGTFLDRTGIPLLGAPIASPGGELLVTVVFYPEGGVGIF